MWGGELREPLRNALAAGGGTHGVLVRIQYHVDAVLVTEVEDVLETFQPDGVEDRVSSRLPTGPRRMKFHPIVFM